MESWGHIQNHIPTQLQELQAYNDDKRNKNNKLNEQKLKIDGFFIENWEINRREGK